MNPAKTTTPSPDDTPEDDPDVEDDDPDDLGGPLGDPPPGGHGKYYVHDVPVRVATEQVQYLDAAGKLITESLRDYSKKTLRAEYASLEQFLSAWNEADRKKAILEAFAAKGVFFDELADLVGRNYDAFDLVAHIAFDQKPLTRRERANRVKKKDVFGQYGEKARAVLDALLQKYADAGITSVESMDILKIDPLRTYGDAQRLEQLGWMFFLKIFDDREIELEAVRDNYKSALPGHLRWSEWAADAEGITGDALLDFVNNTLLPKLKAINGTGGRIATLIRTAFEDANNYMKNGTLMRQVINKINGIDFNASDDRHMFGDIYEKSFRSLSRPSPSRSGLWRRWTS